MKTAYDVMTLVNDFGNAARDSKAIHSAALDAAAFARKLGDAIAEIIVERDALKARVEKLEKAVIGASALQDSDASCGRFTWCPFCGDGRGKAKHQLKHAPDCIVLTCGGKP